MNKNIVSSGKADIGEVELSAPDRDQRTQIEQFHTLRRYILSCREVPSHCEAIEVALKALDHEIEKEKVESGNDNMMRWQDMQLTKMRNGSLGNDNEVLSVPTTKDQVSTDLGKSLAEISTRSITISNTRITSAISAIAVAIHGALVSCILRFQCIGMFELNSKDKKKNEFVTTRQLLKRGFLPVEWDSNSRFNVALSYRKEGYGKAVLIVSLASDVNKEIQIYFGPSGHEESTPLIFLNPDKHINLERLENSLSPSSGRNNVPPSLIYKDLSILLTNFTRCADLGQIYLGEDNEQVNLNAVSSIDGNDSIPSVKAIKQPNGSRRIARKKWANEEHWIQFRLNRKGHVMCKLSEMVKCGFIEYGRKKAGGSKNTENTNNLPASKSKHIRKQCIYCSETVKVDGKVTKRSRFEGAEGKRRPARKPYNGCLACKVPLCDTSPSNDGNHMSCNERWHSLQDLP